MTQASRIRTREPQEGGRRHKLLPKEVQERLPRLGAQDGKGMDALVYLKFFCPYGRGTWYFTEGEPAEEGDDWLLFGYCVSMLGPDCDELGYSSFMEMAEARVFGNVPAIERDCHFAEGQTLRECVDENA